MQCAQVRRDEGGGSPSLCFGLWTLARVALLLLLAVGELLHSAISRSSFLVLVERSFAFAPRASR